MLSDVRVQPTSFIFFIALTAYCGISTSVWSSAATRLNSFEDETCQRQLEQVYSARIVVQNPPQLTGLWTSQQCEIRPGPEFVIRKYRFYDGGLFELDQFFYSDSHCHRPSFAVEARGQFKVYQASWVIPGATEVDYQARYVTVVPYTTDAVDELQKRLSNSSCRIQSLWQPFERHVIFHYVEDEDALQEVVNGEDGVVDCLSSLEISFHELQLMRLEENRIGTADVYRSLFLGDIHPDRIQRMTYRPTGYQEPLAAVETIGCRICRLVGKSSDVYPPQLPIRPRLVLPLLLGGSWASVRCESRNDGVFVTRIVRFADENRTWERREFHFSDGLCRKEKLRVYATGRFYLDERRPSDVIQDAYYAQIQTFEMKVTVLGERLIRQLNQVKSCGRPETVWQPDVEHDVTATNGCLALDVVFQRTMSDVILFDRRSQQTFIYLGQPAAHVDPDTDPVGGRRRPTSFQPPLVRCAEQDDRRITSNRLPHTADDPEGTRAWVASGMPSLTSALDISILISMFFVNFNLM